MIVDHRGPVSAATGAIRADAHLNAPFDQSREEAFRSGLQSVTQELRDAAVATKVSVIVPVLDGAGAVDETIRSVVAQDHRNLELLVVDASSDGARLAWPDRRIKVVRSDRATLAAARNLGLNAASGDIVTYLDAGNRWAAEFLRVMTLFMTSERLACAYCAARLIHDGGVLAYKGTRFDGTSLLDVNAIPLNAFCHDRARYRDLGGFREAEPLAEWDLLLRYTRDCRTGFAPLVGCDYVGSNALTELAGRPLPRALARLMRERHLESPDLPGSQRRAARPVSLTIAIKVAAPAKSPQQWGDYHFGVALRDAFERLGHHAYVDLREQWYVPRSPPSDVAVVLRGPHQYEPDPDEINVLWNISQPDEVPFEEYDLYDQVYVASQSFAFFLRHVVRVPVDALLQATDPDRFHPEGNDSTGRGEVVFVGNTRGEYRAIVRWAVEAGLEPAIYGRGWTGFVPESLVRGEYFDNRNLGALYRSARAVLSDHLASMREFGFISNRVFDVTASAGNLITDYIPSIERIFGPGMRMVHCQEDLQRAFQDDHQAAGDVARRVSLSGIVRREHSFDRRARVMIGDVLRLLGKPEGLGSLSTGQGHGRRPTKVLLVLRNGQPHPDDAAFIRLICPLTAETAAETELVVARDSDGEHVDGTDLCIVQSGAIGDVDRALTFADRLRRSGIPLVLDIDRNPRGEGDATEPVQAFECLRNSATQRWYATQRLLDEFAQDRVADRGDHVVRSTIDPRLWKDYRSPRSALENNEPLQILCVDGLGGSSGPGYLLGGLDQLAEEMPGAFFVTCIGSAAGPQRPWLRSQSRPAAALAYPGFARWLRLQGPFDVGVAPADETMSGLAERRFLEFSALGLLSVLPVSDACAGEMDGLAVLVDDASPGWFAALKDVLSSRQDFIRTAQTAQDHVWRNRRAPTVAITQRELIESALSG